MNSHQRGPEKEVVELFATSAASPRSLVLDLLQDDVGQGGAGLMADFEALPREIQKKLPGDGSSYL